MGASHISKTAPARAAVADRAQWLARPDGRPPHHGDAPANFNRDLKFVSVSKSPVQNKESVIESSNAVKRRNG